MRGNFFAPRRSDRDAARLREDSSGSDRPHTYARSALAALHNAIGNRAVGQMLHEQRADGSEPDLGQAVLRKMGGRAHQQLPHLDAIRRSFGRHDVTGVRARVGGPAAEVSALVGAEAFTVGDETGFSAQPSLALAAHEAAHAVQQRAGIQLAGGAGREGDIYERNADAVAAEVVAGRSAERLLDQVAPRGLNQARSPARSAGTERRGMPLQRKKGWRSRRDEMIATLKLSDPKDAEIVKGVLEGLEDEGKSISEGLSQKGVEGRGTTKAARDKDRAKKLFEKVKADHLDGAEMPDMSEADAGELFKYLNSPVGFGTYREKLIDQVSEDTGGYSGSVFLRFGATPRERIRARHDTGENFTGTGACLQGEKVMERLLRKMKIRTDSQHKFGKSRIEGVGAKDHAWSLLKDGRTIVDGTWKQFWKPIPAGGKDADPTPEDWAILNGQPNVFVGTKEELRARVESFNDKLSTPFSEEYINDILTFYEPGRKKGSGRV